jgi:hypothetical protein
VRRDRGRGGEEEEKGVKGMDKERQTEDKHGVGVEAREVQSAVTLFGKYDAREVALYSLDCILKLGEEGEGGIG